MYLQEVAVYFFLICFVKVYKYIYKCIYKYIEYAGWFQKQEMAFMELFEFSLCA